MQKYGIDRGQKYDIDDNGVLVPIGSSSGNSDQFEQIVMWPTPIDAKKELPAVDNWKPPEQGWLVWNQVDGWKIDTTHPFYWNKKDERGKFYDGPTVEFWMEKPPDPVAI